MYTKLDLPQAAQLNIFIKPLLLHLEEGPVADAYRGSNPQPLNYVVCALPQYNNRCPLQKISGRFNDFYSQTTFQMQKWG